ncbi:hypothetical protein [Acaryochloris sp. IP29b_bin.137]|uniref:hypothetical protein n=1 Tax=Acaryochloris sp. IP29b_bin.137 TaxID=2969217 RepID=UPI00260F668F|nr:hypothetical protein [Acaryochloris sp. IP29b_bin.137]
MAFSNSQERESSTLKKLQLLTTTAVAISGVITGFFSCQAERKSSKVLQDNQEYANALKFSEKIQGQLDNLVGDDSRKANMSLISLYKIAGNEDEKIILYNIAITSNDKAMKNTFLELISDEDKKIQ